MGYQPAECNMSVRQTNQELKMEMLWVTGKAMVLSDLMRLGDFMALENDFKIVFFVLLDILFMEKKKKEIEKS